MWLTFRVSPADTLRLTPLTSPVRKDGLWKTTCFELFLKPDIGERYFELNLSPSSEWAAYAFDSCRRGMRELTLGVEPCIESAMADGCYELSADIDLSDIPNLALRMSLSAVLEETDGTKSYWALAHPPDKPDFHDPACFALRLPAADGP